MFRPWGKLDWAISLSDNMDWHLVGAIGTEDRSLAVYDRIQELVNNITFSFLEIKFCNSRFLSLATQKLKERKELFFQKKGDIGDISEFQLLDELYLIERFSKQSIKAHKSIILDITSMPKRFFFPLIRSYTKNRNIKNLLITYSTPEVYQSETPMSEAADSWGHLPGFPYYGEESDEEVLIVCAGFMIESLQQHLSAKETHAPIKILIPFPAPLDAIRRSWDSVYNLCEKRARDKFELFRVDAMDMNSAFSRICSLADIENASTSFAPFGPKPISAAMCLYAIQKNSAVYYPQPKIYHPEYSTGIEIIDEKPLVNAYWIKHDGEFLYKA